MPMKYRDSSLSIEERVDNLLQRMTIKEKIGQLIQLYGWEVYTNQNGSIALTDAFQEEVKTWGIGSLYGTLRADPWTGVTLDTGLSSREGAEAVNQIQRFAVEATRLGIPILMGEECSHGHMAIGATVFPVPLSLGSTWNVPLYERMCKATAAETRSQGGAITYSPVLDVVRDPRWGRTEECFGEDSFMIGEMAVAAVQGMQGDSLDAPDSMGVTLKHYTGYGSSEGGRNGAPVHMGLRELHTVDLPPFEKAVAAGALSLMTAYNEIDGVPCTSNRYLLTELLREKWGFDGFVITDCGAIDMLQDGHQVAADGEHATQLALQAGVDMEMSGTMFRQYLLNAYEQEKIRIEDIDHAVSRVLKAKFRLGLFERPYANPDDAEAIIGCEEHRMLAHQLAVEGTILLKNSDGILPLQREQKQRIAVIGPNADRIYNQLGDYTSPQQREQISTVLDGVRGKLKDTECEVLYAPGCRVKDNSREGIAQAVACAADADVTILVLGSSSARDFGEGTIDLRTGASIITDTPTSEMDCGEGVDRARLNLSGVQLELAQQIYLLGKPMIVVYINGRPIVEPWIDEHADAILEAWYPGQAGGQAIADLIFGDENPSGKLTITIPKQEGQLPLSYNLKRTSLNRRYVETDLKPRYPFGFGLSYTEFQLEDVHVSRSRIRMDEATEVQVKVTNIGDRAGAEVVQLYITDKYSSVTRPKMELKGFKKVWLAPGESQVVTLPIGFEQLSLINMAYERVIEPGEFVIHIGNSSEQVTSMTLFVEEEN